MTTTRDDPKLRNPEADALREGLATAANELAAAFGVPFAKVSVTDWVKLGGAWRISYVWLLGPDGKEPEPGQVAAENRGFRAIVEGGRCKIEVWSADGQVSFDRSGYITPERASDFLNMSFAQSYNPG